MIDREAIIAATDGETRFDEPMRSHTTFRLGGPADAVAFPTTVASVQRLAALAAERSWPLLPLGGGSNLLVLDGGIRGLVVSLSRLRRIEREGETVLRCEAGVSMPRLVREAAAWGLAGLEFLAGIPGTVGGGLVMNAGTRSGELGGVTVEVTLVDQAGELSTRPREACGFRYRGSDLGAGIVVGARLHLRPGSRDAIDRQIAAELTRRRAREPQGMPCAGSIFKNPPGDSAGRLIEAAGLKGRRLGGAEVSFVHANWIVNRGDATAADVLGLMRLCQETVADRFGVTLEPEVRVLGEEAA